MLVRMFSKKINSSLGYPCYFRKKMSSLEESLPGRKIIDGKPEALKSMEDIPGPRSLPLIGCLYQYLPFIGEYKFTTMYENSLKRYNKYGSIVKETLLPGVNVIYVFDPDDTETVLRYSGKYPERRSHSAVGTFRKEKSDMYSTPGIIHTNGEEWQQLRSVFQKPLSSPQSAMKYIKTTNTIISEFIERIKQFNLENNKKEKRDFLDDLSRLNLQLIGIIAFDYKIDCFSEKEMQPDSFSSKLLAAIDGSNSFILPLDFVPPFMHSIYFKPYKNFYKNFLHLEEVAVSLITKKKNYIKNNLQEFKNSEGERSLLEIYLSNEEINIKDIIAMSVDFLLAGSDTTSYTTSFLLYNLAKNPLVQDKLYEEVSNLVPQENSLISVEILNKASYMKAVLKESLRLFPISIGIGRNVTQDIVLSGYKISKGAVVVTNNQIMCGLQKYFDKPKEFIPERWLKNSEHYKVHHPFLSIPFGHGARMCIARRLAEQNIYIIVMMLVKNFKIEWNGKDLGMRSFLINKPDSPLRFSFHLRQ